MDNIVGVMYCYDLLNKENLDEMKVVPVQDMCQTPPYFIPETMSVWNLLREFRIRKSHMAGESLRIQRIRRRLVGLDHDMRTDDKPRHVFGIEARVSKITLSSCKIQRATRSTRPHALWVRVMSLCLYVVAPTGGTQLKSRVFNAHASLFLYQAESEA